MTRLEPWSSGVENGNSAATTGQNYFYFELKKMIEKYRCDCLNGERFRALTKSEDLVIFDILNVIKFK